ncbi:MAG: ParB N-terminal domain-containing protein [Planctomycetaceae bacterium]|nr:ParB N-terminal domain-containing protein [Planctomycetaceae bacterium]
MNYELLPIDQLKPAPYNPRIKLKPGDAAWKKLERSLDEFDLVQPLVWNSVTGHVVGGHQRLQVLAHRGVEMVPCIVVELSLEREKLLNVALNNPHVGSTWDVDKLLNLMDELVDLPEVDATLTGFDEQEHRDLLFRPAQLRREDPTEQNQPELTRVTLEITPADWPAVEQKLNTLLAEHPNLRLHVGIDAV